MTVPVPVHSKACGDFIALLLRAVSSKNRVCGFGCLKQASKSVQAGSTEWYRRAHFDNCEMAVPVECSPCAAPHVCLGYKQSPKGRVQTELCT